MSLKCKEALYTNTKLLEIAYNNLPYATKAAILIAIMLSVVLWDINEPLLLGGWLVLAVLINTLRYLDARSYLRSPSKYHICEWKNRFYIGLLTSTLLWALFIFIFFPHEAVSLQAFVIIMMAGLSAGAVGSLSPFRQFFITFFVLFLIPLAIMLYLQGGVQYILLSTAMIIYMFSMIAMASKFNANLMNIVRTDRLYLESEQKLHRSQEQILQIFKQAPIGILSFDKNLHVIECNQGLADIMQVDIETIKGIDLNILKGRIIYHDYLQRIFEGEEFHYEGRYRTLINELELWIDVRGTPIYDENGEIEGGLAIVSDITDKKQKEAQIDFLAYHDGLTHLPNRSLLHDRLEQLLVHAEHTRHRSALILIDLDHFKTVNDSLGHHIGDLIIKEFSSRVNKLVRKEDTFSRLGGDEFILLLSELSSKQLEAINVTLDMADKIHQATQQVYNIDGNVLHITASIGVTLIDPKYNDKNDVLKHADLAMYRAKEEGRNRTCFYEEEMDEIVKKRLHLENDLHDAIEKNELKLYYQPIISSRSGEVVCAEALLRYCKSDGTMVYPDDFIPVAEESGLIVPIGYWVIEEACRQFNRWKVTDTTTSLKNIAVNISPKQFMQADFVERLVERIKPYGIDYHVFELELTESVVICDLDQAIIKMKELKEYGFILSMDDFGTGYSSLSYLKTLPFDIIKIDKSFIQNILNNDDDKILVNTILDICNKFNRKVIAEGIETQAHIDYLNGSSCDYYQGYAISRPVEAEDFEVLVENISKTRECVTS